jgi:hypothetical protein
MKEKCKIIYCEFSAIDRALIAKKSQQIILHFSFINGKKL